MGGGGGGGVELEGEEVGGGELVVLAVGGKFVGGLIAV